MRSPLLVRIVAPHFVAGLALCSGPCAPIIAYMRGWPLARIRAYCAKRGWRCEELW
jgi:hypothetical protein